MKKLLASIGILGLSTSLTAGSVVSCGYEPNPKPNPDPTPTPPTPEPTPKPIEINATTKGSNITDGFLGNIFQSTNSDGTKTLWSMGNGAPLQYWDGVEGTWKSDTSSGLTKGSNITNGYAGSLFQASDGTLWSMGDGTKLQYWDADAETWKSDTSSGLTKGSNIVSGSALKSNIFESTNADGTKTLWSMGNGTPLQYWDATAQTWKSDTSSGLTKGSNIMDGEFGNMFQSTNSDGTKTLWSMGAFSTLQYWDAGAGTWKSDPTSGLTKGSNIMDGTGGCMFQDSSGTLWSMGGGSSLQYWDAGAGTWQSATDQQGLLTYGSGIAANFAGKIFEDSSGTLWSTTQGAPLQYWDADAGTWQYDTTSGLTKGSNITDGAGGVIFESSDGTLWSMGYLSPLQYWDATNTEWTSDTSSGLTKGSNIMNGSTGNMFETANGTLLSLGRETSLQYWDAANQTWKNNTD